MIHVDFVSYVFGTLAAAYQAIKKVIKIAKNVIIWWFLFRTYKSTISDYNKWLIQLTGGSCSYNTFVIST